MSCDMILRKRWQIRCTVSVCRWHTERAPSHTCRVCTATNASPAQASFQPQMAQDHRIARVQSVSPVGGVAGCGFP